MSWCFGAGGFPRGGGIQHSRRGKQSPFGGRYRDPIRRVAVRGEPVALRHAGKLDLKVAAGPVTFALRDLGTLFAYFTLAAWWL